MSSTSAVSEVDTAAAAATVPAAASAPVYHRLTEKSDIQQVHTWMVTLTNNKHATPAALGEEGLFYSFLSSGVTARSSLSVRPSVRPRVPCASCIGDPVWNRNRIQTIPTTVYRKEC